jgi:hypothetical protein
VEKAVAADREVNERSLNGWFQIDNFPPVNIPRIAFVTGTLDVELFENAVLYNRYATFLGLEHIDQHFFFHAVSF